MEQSYSSIIDAEEAVSFAAQPGVIIVDTRTGPGAGERYATEHLDGALFVDLDTALAEIGTDAAKGGRHPLPKPAKFGEVLNQLGISLDSHVLVYDDKNASSAAARFWWMLRSMGHEKVQVIDGGMQAAIEAGFKTSNTVSKAKLVNTDWPVSWQLPLADITDVKKASADRSANIIDVRSRERYDGDEEPIDLVAGHISGALNIPFTENLSEDGRFQTPEVLRELYDPVMKHLDPGNVIVHCGSGVTACHTLLALAHAGFKIPRLYVGSWSEWSRNELPIATKTNGL